MATLRNTVQIGPSRYKVRKHKWGTKLLADSRGYHSDANEIGIETRLPKDMEAEVFMHEVLHGIWYTFNVEKAFAPDEADEMEEFLVSTLSTALCTVFVQNPWLLPYLTKALLTKR